MNISIKFDGATQVIVAREAVRFGEYDTAPQDFLGIIVLP